MHTSLENLTIGALAIEAKVGVETIRFYQRKGLMQEPERSPGSVWALVLMRLHNC
jgi:MerR family mercuric resistance operon transcriptional regulator